VLRDEGLYIKGKDKEIFQLIEILPDGNCLFRAMSFFIEKGNQENHMKYRREVIEYIKKNKEEYQPIFENE